MLAYKSQISTCTRSGEEGGWGEWHILGLRPGNPEYVNLYFFSGVFVKPGNICLNQSPNTFCYQSF